MKPRPGTAGGCSPSAPHESIYRLKEGGREEIGEVEETGEKEKQKNDGLKRKDGWIAESVGWSKEKGVKRRKPERKDRRGARKVRNEAGIKENSERKRKMQISDLFCTCFFFTLVHCGFCSRTLQALCASIVHCPADQRHCDTQQNKEDPVFSQPGHKESLHPSYAVWQNTTKAHKKGIIKHLLTYFF